MADCFEEARRCMAAVPCRGKQVQHRRNTRNSAATGHVGIRYARRKATRCGRCFWWRAPAYYSAHGGVSLPLEYGVYIILHTYGIGRGMHGQYMVADEKPIKMRAALEVFISAHIDNADIAMDAHLKASGGRRHVLPLYGHLATPRTLRMTAPYVVGLIVQKAPKDEPLSPRVHHDMVMQLAQVLAWMHSCRDTHLDWKPGTVLWDPGGCYLVLVGVGMALPFQEGGPPESKHSPRRLAITVGNHVGAHAGASR